MKAANDIYKETTYTKHWQKMQNTDKMASGWYLLFFNWNSPLIKKSAEIMKNQNWLVQKDHAIYFEYKAFTNRFLDKGVA